MRFLVLSVVCGLVLASHATWSGSTTVVGKDQPERRSPEQIRSVVDGLWKKDVAWREIQWRTCLIDGLRESRSAGKPVLLWIFIDRPIDDERC